MILGMPALLKKADCSYVRHYNLRS